MMIFFFPGLSSIFFVMLVPNGFVEFLSSSAIQFSELTIFDLNPLFVVCANLNTICASSKAVFETTIKSGDFIKNLKSKIPHFY